jgi:structure-specific recognition protein 1
VRCNLKTADGFLFPLDKAFMFVPKPTQYIPYKVRLLDRA